QYGFGHSEEVVGRALREYPGRRPYVFTKAGQPEGPNRMTVPALRRDSLRRELEESLARLGVDAIHLYQIHWPIPDEELEEGWSSSSGSSRSLGGTTSARARPRSPGRCATRPSTGRSWASGGPTRSIRSFPPPTCS